MDGRVTGSSGDEERRGRLPGENAVCMDWGMRAGHPHSDREGLLVRASGFDAVVEAGVVGEEVEADFAGGAVAVFGDVDDG